MPACAGTDRWLWAGLSPLCWFALSSCSTGSTGTDQGRSSLAQQLPSRAFSIHRNQLAVRCPGVAVPGELCEAQSMALASGQALQSSVLGTSAQTANRAPLMPTGTLLVKWTGAHWELGTVLGSAHSL